MRERPPFGRACRISDVGRVAGPNSDTNRDEDQLNIRPESAMRWHTRNASSPSAGIADDILQLIPPNERAAFREMLEIEFHGRELSGHEKRRAAERIWHRFLR
jgi:hypothetical protein